MHLIRTLIGACIFLLMITPADAGGLIQKLPKDGSWVKYDVNWKLYLPGSEISEAKGTWNISVLGTTSEKNKQCRWLEFQRHLDAHDNEPASIVWYKYLIPEEALKSSQTPVDEVIRFWTKSGKPLVATKNEPPYSYSISLFLQGKADRSRKNNQQRTFQYQQGELKCQTQLVESFSDKKSQTTIEFTSWKHDKIPFGVAGGRMVMKRWRNGAVYWTWIREFSVREFGTGAKTALPDAK